MRCADVLGVGRWTGLSGTETLASASDGCGQIDSALTKVRPTY